MAVASPNTMPAETRQDRLGGDTEAVGQPGHGLTAGVEPHGLSLLLGREAIEAQTDAAGAEVAADRVTVDAVAVGQGVDSHAALVVLDQLFPLCLGQTAHGLGSWRSRLPGGTMLVSVVRRRRDGDQRCPDQA